MDDFASSLIVGTGGGGDGSVELSVVLSLELFAVVAVPAALTFRLVGPRPSSSPAVLCLGLRGPRGPRLS